MEDGSRLTLNRGLLLALLLVILSVAVVAMIDFMGGTRSGALSVAEIYGEVPSSLTRVEVHGYVTDEGVDLERYGFWQFSIADSPQDDLELPVSIDASVFSPPTDLQAGSEVVVTGHLRGKVLEASGVVLN